VISEVEEVGLAARLFATKDRKLRTLESLVKLARGE